MKKRFLVLVAMVVAMLAFAACSGKEKIGPVAEEDAYVNFDGVKLSMTITWEDFLKFMDKHDWTFIDDEDEFPHDDQYWGSGYIKTNCGKVDFSFMANEDETGSELRGVTFFASDTNGKISCQGITNSTKREEVDKALELESESEYCLSYYLDDYLTINMRDLWKGKYDIHVDREMYRMRK